MELYMSIYPYRGVSESNESSPHVPYYITFSIICTIGLTRKECERSEQLCAHNMIKMFLNIFRKYG